MARSRLVRWVTALSLAFALSLIFALAGPARAHP